MTSNQLQYWANKETERANRAREQENYRSNVAREEENRRSNIARETETNRSNLANEDIKRTDVNWGNTIKTADTTLKYLVPDANARRRSFDNLLKQAAKLVDIFE